MEAKLRIQYRDATVKVGDTYIMLDGSPVGELGQKWWSYKVINAIRWDNKEKRRRLRC